MVEPIILTSLSIHAALIFRAFYFMRLFVLMSEYNSKITFFICHFTTTNIIGYFHCLIKNIMTLFYIRSYFPSSIYCI